MLHPLGPGHIRDMDQAVDSGLDFDEGAEAGQVANLAVDPGAHRVLERQHHPGILLRLLHSERDLLLGLVHLQHHRFDGFTDAHDLRRMANIPGPAHLGDVDQPLDTGLDFHEGAVVGDRDDLALNPGAHRILRGDVLPGIGLQLLHAQADPLSLPVDIEDFDLDFLTDGNHFGGVRHPAVGHVGDVQQPVDATEVDERAEVGDVVHHAFADLPHRELLHQVLALVGPLVLEDNPAADHDIAPPLVQLDDLELVGLAQQLVDIGHPPKRDLAAGQEGVHTHQVYHHSALDLLDQGSLDRLIALVGHADLLPDPHKVGLLLGQDDGAFLVLEVLEENLDLVTFFEGVRILELVEGNGAFGLEADVENYRIIRNPQDLRLDD